MDEKKNNSLVNLSIIFLSFWVLFSAWQMNNLFQENLNLKQKINDFYTKSEQQAILTNQAILNAVLEYNIRHDVTSAKYWLTIALHNTTPATNPRCVDNLKNILQEIDNKKTIAIDNEHINNMLSSILKALVDDNTINSEDNGIMSQHKLTSMFKSSIPSNSNEIFDELEKLIKKSTEAFQHDFNTRQLEFDISKAMDIIINIQTMHPEIKEKSIFIYTQLKAIKSHLHHPSFVIEALSYCNTPSSVVTISDFSSKRFKKSSKADA